MAAAAAHKMTLKSGGGGGQACAACKHQRRRCTPDCLLVPFFPADQPKVFQSVHRLFGVKHVQNLLKGLSTPEERVVAVHSIKFHAAMRDRHPVYGCCVEIRRLASQIQIAEEELHLLLRQLAHYRQQCQLVDPPGNGGGGGVLIDKHSNNVDSLVADIDSSLFINQTRSMLQETSQDYLELHPFFENILECQSSLESPVKESTEHAAENQELKSAAARFSLTSVK